MVWSVERTCCKRDRSRAEEGFFLKGGSELEYPFGKHLVGVAIKRTIAPFNLDKTIGTCAIGKPGKRDAPEKGRHDMNRLGRMLVRRSTAIREPTIVPLTSAARDRVARPIKLDEESTTATNVGGQAGERIFKWSAVQILGIYRLGDRTKLESVVGPIPNQERVGAEDGPEFVLIGTRSKYPTFVFQPPRALDVVDCKIV